MKIFVAGHAGMVGSALVRALEAAGHVEIVTRGKAELDLRREGQVAEFFEAQRPDIVYLAAAKVGGIQANLSAPADFLHDNLAIQTNVIHQAWRWGVKKLCFLGTSCIYPRDCPQPMKEEHLLTGPLEPTNEAYALAKIAGLKMAQAYERQHGLACICPMPCNLYGTNDSFDPVNSHVLSALVRRFVDAHDQRQSVVTVWGTGRARREFLHVDDLARAVLLLMDRWPSSELINVGSGSDVSIQELAELVADLVGYRGEIGWDTSKPDGTPRKCLDVSKISALGFRPEISLAEGIRRLISEYRARRDVARPAGAIPSGEPVP
jgi:GDP-L-fucose synthase